MPDSVTAALVGLCSAIILEMLRHLMTRSQKTMDDATAFRHDLLSRIDVLEKDKTVLIRDREEWQEKYYAEREQRVKAEWLLASKGQVLQELDVPPEAAP